MNDNDISDHLISQVLDMYEEQGRRPIGFIIDFNDGPTDQVLSQALNGYESWKSKQRHEFRFQH